ncbi:MAG: ABC transporter ATP-binding protein [Syntrophaceae bacterium]|nr:ABC transporter ATP-binding protein [Deltaproteobacteria bacterium]
MGKRDRLIRVDGLTFAYEKGRPVFSDLSFSLPRGMVCTFMGGNGSGKTTLLQCMSGLLPPLSGSISLDGKDIRELGRRDIARMISIVPQEHSIVFPYTVRNMVIMGRAPYIDTLSSPAPLDLALAEEAMEEVGISTLAQKPYTNISGGERQLVLIARALAQNTRLMILDEPTSHLDFKNQILILSLLRRLVRQKGLLAVISSHDPNQALYFSDEVMILHRGSILKRGLPHEVITRETIKEVYSVDVNVITENGVVRGVMPDAHRLHQGELPS